MARPVWTYFWELTGLSEDVQQLDVRSGEHRPIEAVRLVFLMAWCAGSATLA